jgi:uncharacterized UPF0160 family protein
MHMSFHINPHIERLVMTPIMVADTITSPRPGMMQVLTHHGGWHADELHAIALWMLAHGYDPAAGPTIDGVVVIRTRDPQVISIARALNAHVDNPAHAIPIFDVGGIYQPASLSFDHHQADFTESRSNGIAYSTAGLVWKEMGSRIVRHLMSHPSNDDISCIGDMVHAIDKHIIQWIDAIDTGSCRRREERIMLGTVDGRPVHVSHDADYDGLWSHISIGPDDVNFIWSLRTVMLRLITMIHGIMRSYMVPSPLSDAICDSVDDRILIMRREGPWIHALTKNPSYDTIMLVVFPSDQTWRIQWVPSHPPQFDLRGQGFPESWRGLGNNDISIATLHERGADTDIIFCHKTGFLCVSKTFEGAIKTARSVLSGNRAGPS